MLKFRENIDTNEKYRIYIKIKKTQKEVEK